MTSAAEPPVILVKRRFTIEGPVIAAFVPDVSIFIDSWHDELLGAGGTAFDEPRMLVRAAYRGPELVQWVTVTGMALVPPELADRLDEA